MLPKRKFHSLKEKLGLKTSARDRLKKLKESIRPVEDLNESKESKVVQN